MVHWKILLIPAKKAAQKAAKKAAKKAARPTSDQGIKCLKQINFKGINQDVGTVA